MQNGRPIAFSSRSLTDTEIQYANVEEKLLVVVFAYEWCIITYMDALS